MTGLEDLIKKIRDYNPEANFELIKRAFEFADIAHAGQMRLSGEPVINHPLAVAKILANLKLDSPSIAAALLHDVVEDTNVTFGELENEFGKEISGLVDGVTKIGNIKLTGSSDEEFVENLRKMLLAMVKDLRVILIKLADRLHNMKTLQYLAKEKQERISRETLEVYAPLAERLGIGQLKGELEDLAFPFVYPKEYQWLIEYSRPYYKHAEEFLKKAEQVVYEELVKEKISNFEIHSRKKHLYSLWRKLSRPEIDRDITKIYDLVAMRILVETVKDCYAALGVVHKIWKPFPAKWVSDFIAQPKPNGYRSIHTTVFSLRERILEVQIRTFEMHEEAENGVAAYWYYSVKKSRQGMDYKTIEKGFFAPTERMGWVRQLVAWQKEIVDSKEFMEALKFDGLTHRIYVFSPKGDVFDLPAGATPVDFAYAVHTRLGDGTNGAKVNGKMVSLDYKLKSGDLVEILEKEGSKPSEKWLRFVVTQEAKRKISKHFRKRD